MERALPNAHALPLDLPTNRTATGPIIGWKEGRLHVEYDYENDDGSRRHAGLVFEEVLAFEWRDAACCAAGDVVSATEVRSTGNSPSLDETLEPWQETVGWQAWQQEKGGRGRFKHFTLFFDDAGCIHVVASGVRLGTGR